MKNKNSLLIKIMSIWLTLVFVITILIGFTYISIQQTLRIGANDPQIQIAEDISSTLAQAKQLPALNPAVDLTKSLATFVTIFDNKGQPVASTGELSGRAPALPIGVFQYALAHGENHLTWQPVSHLRFAVVIVPYGNKSGYILVGRSLREVEKRIDQITIFAAISWFASVVGSFVILFLSKLIL